MCWHVVSPRGAVCVYIAVCVGSQHLGQQHSEVGELARALGQLVENLSPPPEPGGSARCYWNRVRTQCKPPGSGWTHEGLDEPPERGQVGGGLEHDRRHRAGLRPPSGTRTPGVSGQRRRQRRRHRSKLGTPPKAAAAAAGRGNAIALVLATRVIGYQRHILGNGETRIRIQRVGEVYTAVITCGMSRVAMNSVRSC